MIRTILTTAYLYGLLPLLLGTGAALVRRDERIMPAQLYAAGWALYLCVFSLVSALAIRGGGAYHLFKAYWFRTLIALTVAGVIFCALYVRRLSGPRAALKPLFTMTRRDAILICAGILLILFAILFTVPHLQDEMPEYARLTLGSDQIFSIRPESGKPYYASTKVPGALHLLYAAGADLAGTDVTAFIHLAMPVFMLAFFFCCYRSIAYILFPQRADGPQKDIPRETKLFIFPLCAYAAYLIFTFADVNIALAVYRNIWHTATLAAACLFPLFFACCLGLIRSRSAAQAVKCAAALIIVAGALYSCFTYSPLLCAIVLAAAVITRVLLAVIARLSPAGGPDKENLS